MYYVPWLTGILYATWSYALTDRPTDNYVRPVGRLQSLRLFFGSLRPRGGESTAEVIDKDADSFRSHEPGRQKYHRGATAPRAADIVATATATYSLRAICRRRSQLAAERGHDQKLDVGMAQFPMGDWLLDSEWSMLGMLYE